MNQSTIEYFRCNQEWYEPINFFVQQVNCFGSFAGKVTERLVKNARVATIEGSEQNYYLYSSCKIADMKSALGIIFDKGGAVLKYEIKRFSRLY